MFCCLFQHGAGSAPIPIVLVFFLYFLQILERACAPLYCSCNHWRYKRGCVNYSLHVLLFLYSASRSDLALFDPRFRLVMDDVKSCLAGWAGGMVNVIVGHPFDTVKTLMQAAPPGHYSGSVDCLQRLWQREGVMGLYSGVTAPMAVNGVMLAISFLSYDACERLIRRTKQYDPEMSLPMRDVMVCGAFGGVLYSFILGPAELLKIQQQTAASQGHDGSLAAVSRRIWRNGGCRAFMCGTGATLMRDVPGSVSWFGAYEATKNCLCDNPRKPSIPHALFAGGMAGLAMWISILPVDTVKTRVQAARGARLTFSQAAADIYSNSGIAGFYRGIGPALLRAFPANAALFAAKEVAHAVLDHVF